MSTDKYNLAIKTFMLEPGALTDEQIDVFKGVDDQLAKRAANKRSECQTKAAQARHRAAMGQQPVKASTVEQMTDSVVDHITLALVVPRQRIKVLEDLNATLQQQVRTCAIGSWNSRRSG